jgi:hypothetical protein
MVAVLQGDPGLPPERRLSGIEPERVEEAVLSLLAAAQCSGTAGPRGDSRQRTAARGAQRQGW